MSILDSAIRLPICWSPPKGPLRRRKTGAFKVSAIISAVRLVAYSSCSMSRVLCFKAQDANCFFRLSWATSAIRFGLGMRRFDGPGDGFSRFRAPESPLHPSKRAFSKVAVSDRFAKQCVCIWALLILLLDAVLNRLLLLVP